MRPTASALLCLAVIPLLRAAVSVIPPPITLGASDGTGGSDNSNSFSSDYYFDYDIPEWQNACATPYVDSFDSTKFLSKMGCDCTYMLETGASVTGTSTATLKQDIAKTMLRWGMMDFLPGPTTTTTPPTTTTTKATTKTTPKVTTKTTPKVTTPKAASTAKKMSKRFVSKNLDVSAFSSYSPALMAALDAKRDDYLKAFDYKRYTNLKGCDCGYVADWQVNATPRETSDDLKWLTALNLLVNNKIDYFPGMTMPSLTTTTKKPPPPTTTTKKAAATTAKPTTKKV